MVKTPTRKGKAAIARPPYDQAVRTRRVLPPYDQAVRATLEGGDRGEIEALLQGAKNLRAEHGSFDSLITTLEDALRKAG
jgi:hypothetical protein